MKTKYYKYYIKDWLNYEERWDFREAEESSNWDRCNDLINLSEKRYELACIECSSEDQLVNLMPVIKEIKERIK